MASFVRLVATSLNARNVLSVSVIIRSPQEKRSDSVICVRLNTPFRLPVHSVARARSKNSE